MDCVYSCPVKQSLKVADKKGTKYLAPIAVVLLIAVSLGFADNIELSTISERWNNFAAVGNIGIYEQSDLKNVKCFGSAMSLKNQIDNIEGIHGIDAYAASHSVKIYYDADKLTARDVKSAIFRPSKQRVRTFNPGEFDSLSIFKVGIDKLFDNVDFVNLVYALRENEGVYGFETEFGEPVQTSIYFRSDLTSPNEIEEFITKDEIEVKKRTGMETLKLPFEIHESGELAGTISAKDYSKHMFSGFSRDFNKYDTFDIAELSVLIYPMPEADHPMLKRQIPYLMSHISNNDGIVRLATIWDEGPKACIFFAPELTPIDSVKKYLSSEILRVTFTSGEKKEVQNPFKSKPEGEVKPAAEVIDQLQ
jgi:copper chaperone CopZ